ncbi:MAG: InlB B-repeat-containing protein, partial [Clostridia bacterium]|nr:InlB B-repeat-containing protein [Clostridia bacterium]
PTGGTYVYGETVTVASSVTKAGYTFGGWNDGSATYAAGASYTMPDANVTLTAVWTAATDTAYTVEHYQQNANDSNYTLADTDNLTGTTGDSVTATAKTYANFYENLVHADREESGTILADGTLVLKLFYDRDSYFVGYDSDGGDTQPFPAPYLYGQTVTVEAATAKTGYTFDGWNDGTVTRAPGSTFTMPAQNVTLTAQWTANNYDVTYDAGAAGTNAASMPAPSSHATDSLVIISSTEPTWEDHAFTGWLYNGTTYKRDGLDQFVMPAGNVTMTAQWDDVEYGVTYVGNGADSGVPSDSNTYLVGVDVPVGTAPVRSGYQFGGWSTGGVTYAPGANVPMVSGGLTLTAVWNEEFNVTYEAPDNETGTVPSDSSAYIEGDTVDILSDEPARAGYTFDGWTKSGDTTVYKYGTAEDSFLMTAGDVTLTAQWTAIDYNVTYDDNDGDASTLPPTDSNNYNVGSSVTLAAAPPRDGYTFDGWNDGSSTYAAGASYTMPADDVTFTAEWTLTEYTVTLDKQSGTGGADSVGVAYNNPMPEAMPPTRDGFEFDGYYSEPNGAGTKYYNYDMSSANNWDKYEGGTIYANWLPVSTGIDVTPETSIINVGEDVTLTAVHTPSGSSHDPVVWDSSDPTIASVDPATGVVTGLKVGRVIITATAGTLSDTAIVEVRSAEPDDPTARKIVVEGDIFYTDDETPIPGIEMTLYSTPIRGTSNASGYFYLGNTTEGTHTLTAEVTAGSEIGRIVPVTFTRGATESYVINSDGSVHVTFTDTTDRIYLRLEIPRATGVLGVRDVRFSGYEATPAVNPPTGDDSTWWESAMDWIKEIFD